jgi:hypothetical protein
VAERGGTKTVVFSHAVEAKAKMPGLAAAMCRAYNRRLADYGQPYPDRLFRVAMLPMQSVDLAIDEMRPARERLRPSISADDEPAARATWWRSDARSDHG